MMKMKIVVIAVLGVVMGGCSSSTTLEDVQKQEDKARSELMDAKEELVDLAEAKEEYSVDSKDKLIKEYQTRQKAIGSDIKNLKNLKSEKLMSNSESMIGDLEREDKQLVQKIDQLKKQKTENWESARDSIDTLISSLEQKIDQITSNIPEE
jgi:ABC-type transporter Mla subunit MlaD